MFTNQTLTFLFGFKILKKGLIKSKNSVKLKTGKEKELILV